MKNFQKNLKNLLTNDIRVAIMIIVIITDKERSTK
jgi:hypothetical protein